MLSLKADALAVNASDALTPEYGLGPVGLETPPLETPPLETPPLCFPTP